MKNLAARLSAVGFERRFALDIGSVIGAIRPRGLMHLPVTQKDDLLRILRENGLRVEAERSLFRRADLASREGLLLESDRGEGSSAWCEVWYSRPDVPAADPVALFRDTGRFLGYPPCCRKALEGGGSLARLFQKYIFSDRNRYWEVNRLATIFHDVILMPDFFPCSLSCTAARDFVLPFHELAQELLDPADFDSTVGAMRAPLTLISGEIVQWREWRLDGESLIVSAASAKKEKLSKVASFPGSSGKPAAQLLSFRGALQSAPGSSPTKIVITVMSGEAVELPLTSL